LFEISLSKVAALAEEFRSSGTDSLWTGSCPPDLGPPLSPSAAVPPAD